MGTEIIVQLGRLDGKGNVIPAQPLKVTLQDLSGEDFAKAFSVINRQRFAMEEEEAKMAASVAAQTKGE